MSNTKNKKVIEADLINDIKKDLAVLRLIVERCGIEELFYFLASINFEYHNGQARGADPDEKVIEIQHVDIYKYLIGYLLTEGVFEEKPSRNPDPLLIEALVNTVRIINSKYQGINLIHLFTEAELDTTTDQIKVDISELGKNERVQKFNKYSIRIQDNLQDGLGLKSLGQSLQEFYDEFNEHNDLFTTVFEGNITDFLNSIWRIHYLFLERVSKKESDFTITNEMLIDSTDLSNHINFSKLLIFSSEELGNSFLKILDKFIFKTAEFDPMELRYDQVSRTPIIKLGKNYLVSFELLIGSLQLNTHYTLMSDKSIGEMYKKRISSQFEEKIIKVAKRLGYRVANRNLMLYEGKNMIGDVDLILENSSISHKIHIEAKCYALHANIQAHDPKIISENLNKQKEDWEYKVKRRKSRLTGQVNDGNIEYIIVTKNPEILGHFSDLLVLSLEEFETYLKNTELTFEEIIEEHYSREYPQKMETYNRLFPSIRPVK